MSMRHVWGVAAALVVGLGCGNGIPDPKLAPHLDDLNGSFAYSAFDATGQPLLVGSLTIEAAPDSTLSGTWSIHWAPGADTTATIGPQVGTGTLAGRSGSDGVFVDLNPGWADNNVFLMGGAAPGILAGEWQHSTILGPVAQGRFTLRRLSE